jgi:hypothetical protein
MTEIAQQNTTDLIYMSLYTTAINTVVSLVCMAITELVKILYAKYNILYDYILSLIFGKLNIYVYNYNAQLQGEEYLTFDKFIMSEINKLNPCNVLEFYRTGASIKACPIKTITHDNITYTLSESDLKDAEVKRGYSKRKSMHISSRKKTVIEMKKIIDDFNAAYTKIIRSDGIVICKGPDMHMDIFKTKFDKGLESVYSLNVKNSVAKALDTYREKSEKLVMMFHGPPGTGKTTLIRAISKELDGVMVMTKLSSFKSIDSLRSFVYRNSFPCLSEKRMFVSVEPTNRIIVFEDVDSDAYEMLKKRSNIEVVEETKLDADSIKDVINDILDIKPSVPKPKDVINLSDILNLLDGILPLGKIIIIFTTNCIKEIDPAFYRPGRMDICEHIGELEHNEVINFINDMYPDNKFFTAQNMSGMFKISRLFAAKASTNTFEEFRKKLNI